jgi:hypothetical protein
MTLLRKDHGLVKVTDEGAVIYKSEKAECRPFPDTQSPGLRQGVKRNFQILPVLEFIAEFTQHIPIKGSHLIRYSGWYSNKERGIRGIEPEEEKPKEVEEETTFNQARRQQWAMLIQRVYEVDPMICPRCGGQMVVISFIPPPMEKVIDKILKHCASHPARAFQVPSGHDLHPSMGYGRGLWEAPLQRAPPGQAGYTVDPDEGADSEYIDIDTFLSEL